MCGGRSYGDGGSVVGCQREVKGYGGHGESPVHLHWSGCHTGETLRDEEVLRKRDRETEWMEREKEESRL